MAYALDQEKIVTDWLKTVFGDEPLPKFSPTPQLTAHLYDLMLRHTALQKSIDAYQVFSCSSQESVASDEREIMMLLNVCGLTEALKHPTLEEDQLTRLANTLSLSNPDDSSYILALSKLSLDKEQTTSNYELYKQSVAGKKRELTHAISSAKRLEQMVSREESRELNSRTTTANQNSQAPFLSRKISKYNSDKRQYDGVLDESGLRMSLTHDKLVESYNELKSLEAKLEQTNRQLNMYADLPPDRELAKVKLAVAKAELHELEEKLVRQCDLYHL